MWLVSVVVSGEETGEMLEENGKAEYLNTFVSKSR